MSQQTLRTREEVLAEFERKGISIASWAKKHGVHPATANAVLKNRIKPRIGKSHNAAVLLGIKEGELYEDAA